MMEYSVNGTTLKYDVVGKRHRGENRVLLHDAVDLTEGTAWHNTGFTIESLFYKETYTAFSEATRELLISSWKKTGLDVPAGIELNQYHTLIKDFNAHLRAIEYTRLLPIAEFPLSIGGIENRISEICGTRLIAKNPFDGQEIFHFRVIRPSSGDNNPLHRDVWLEDYDNCINLYIPVTGSNEGSSLILIPGSHVWPESKIEKTEAGAEINGIKFNVPAVTSIEGNFQAARPNPRPNQVLVFSPYLIHGGAVNLNSDTTRISIELRLWKR